jgi:hypothetical protein
MNGKGVKRPFYTLELMSVPSDGPRISALWLPEPLLLCAAPPRAVRRLLERRFRPLRPGGLVSQSLLSRNRLLRFLPGSRRPAIDRKPLCIRALRVAHGRGPRFEALSLLSHTDRAFLERLAHDFEGVA